MILNGGMDLSNKTPELISLLIRILSSSTQIKNEGEVSENLADILMSSDDEEFIEPDEEAKTFDNELNEQISGMKTPLDNFNKYSYFRDGMEYLKQSNPELFTAVL